MLRLRNKIESLQKRLVLGHWVILCEIRVCKYSADLDKCVEEDTLYSQLLLLVIDSDHRLLACILSKHDFGEWSTCLVNAMCEQRGRAHACEEALSSQGPRTADLAIRGPEPPAT